MRFLPLLLFTGCILTPYRQDGLEIAKQKIVEAQDGTEEVAISVNKLIDEYNKSIKEERLPLLEPIVETLTTSITKTNNNLNTAGEVISTMQEDIGKSENMNLPNTEEQIRLWRTKYIVMTKAVKAAINWAKSNIPFKSGNIQTKAPEPWSGTDIAALIGSIVTATGALGIGTKKANEWRKAANEGEYIANHLKTKCNGNGEFASTMENAPTLVRRHRQKKVKEV